jgi:hypothetical protein
MWAHYSRERAPASRCSEVKNNIDFYSRVAGNF